MKKIITKLLLLLVPILLVLLVIEFQLTKVKNSYNAKISGLAKCANQVNTIILGSSQSYYGINPVYFTSKAFNLANASQTLNYDKEILFKEIGKLPNLKNVVIPVSYFSFYFD